MKIRFLGTYNSQSRKTKFVTIIIDDILALDAGCLSSELTLLEQKNIKAILLTHGHYDHIKDIPSFAFNNTNETTMIYGNNKTLEILSTHLIDGLIYPNFTKKNHYLKKPSLKFFILEPFKKLDLFDYKVTPVNVNHTISSLGYEIISNNGKSIFFSGDTGPGFSDIWININPQVLILDLTFPNKMEEIAINSKHLCPKLLKEELLEFYKIKGYFPEVFLLHLNPNYESEISKEINDLSKNMNIKINVNNQGKIINI